MSDNNNNAKTMYEAVPAAAELNKVPGFDPLKFLRRAGDSMKLDLPYCVSAIGIHNGDSHTIISRIPEIRGCALAHAAATTVNISVTALCKRGGREQTKYQGKAAQEGEKSLQIHHTPFFLK